MPLYRVERTFVAIVDAPSYRSAERARFRPDWDAESSSVTEVTHLSDVPPDWRSVPPVSDDGHDAGTTTIRDLLTTPPRGEHE